MVKSNVGELHMLNSGVKPALQGRSKRRRDELINTGMKLMCEKSFDDISIIELTAKCGYSVGTFYSRFEDKESFFNAVQKTAVVEILDIIAAAFASPSWKSASKADILSEVVRISVNNMSGIHKGIIQASIVMSASTPEVWEPMRECGQAVAKILCDLLQNWFLDDEPEKSRASIYFGLQMCYGTLIQAALNNPGPVKLTDPAMGKNLTYMLTRYVDLKPD